MSVAPITCHILDTSYGKPAANVACSLYYVGPLIEDAGNEEAYEVKDKKPFAMSRTNEDGRVKNWVFRPDLNADEKTTVGISQSGEWNTLKPGIYKIKFLTGKYFFEKRDSERTFFPFVEIIYKIENPPDKHYHIPLLLSNHSYTTYRGS